MKIFVGATATASCRSPFRKGVGAIAPPGLTGCWAYHAEVAGPRLNSLWAHAGALEVHCQ